MGNDKHDNSGRRVRDPAKRARNSTRHRHKGSSSKQYDLNVKDLSKDELPFLFLKPYLKYLRPHVWRLAFAFTAMFIVSFFGAFNILILVKPLEILFGASTASVTDVVKEHLPLYKEQVAEWQARGRPEEPLNQSLEELVNAAKAKELRDMADKSRKLAKEELQNGVNQGESAGAAETRGWLSRKSAAVKAGLKARYDSIKISAMARYADFGEWIKENPLKALFLFAGFLVGMTVIKGAFEYVSNYFMSYSLYHAVIHIKADIFRHIMRQDYGFFISRTTGFLESRITNDVNQIKMIFDGLINDGMQQPLNVFFYFMVLVTLSPQLTWIVVIGGLLGFIPLIYFAKAIKRVTRKSKQKADELSSSAVESLSNFRVVKIFGCEEYEVRKFVKLNDRMFKLFMSRRLARFANSPIMESIGAVSAAAVLIAGGILVIGPGGREPILPPAHFIVYLLACSRFYTPMRKLSRLNINWATSRVAAQRMHELLMTEPRVVDSPDPAPLDLPPKSIEFRGAGFSYGVNEVLKDVTFRLDAGKVVALVGRSGSGKSTLANLMPRLFDPTEGMVLLNGRDIRDYRINDIRQLFGVVTQDTVLFNETVEANIAYGQEEIDRERVRSAARTAHADEFIMNLEGGRGYRTLIGPNGAMLSGGQRQRLAIARALYRDPDILIFDEATSSLDVESERHVQQAIDNLLTNRTALIIAHRLSTVRHADEILVLRDGRIVERGDHASLLAQRGEYWRLYHIAVEQEVAALDESGATSDEPGKGV